MENIRLIASSGVMPCVESGLSRVLLGRVGSSCGIRLSLPVAHSTAHEKTRHEGRLIAGSRKPRVPAPRLSALWLLAECGDPGGENHLQAVNSASALW